VGGTKEKAEKYWLPEVGSFGEAGNSGSDLQKSVPSVLSGTCCTTLPLAWK